MHRMLAWLARRRVAIGFVAAVAAFWFARPTRGTLTAGAIIAVAGELLRIWAAGHLEKGREVTSSGPYRVLRHPLYAGSTLIGIGFAIASASYVVMVLVSGYVALTIGAAVATEEAHLTAKFGAAYPDYRAGRASGDPRRRFSWSRAMRNREYRAVLGLIAALAVLMWKAL